MAMKVKVEIDTIEQVCRDNAALLEVLKREIQSFNQKARFSSMEWSGIAAEQYQVSINRMIAKMNEAYKNGLACNKALKSTMNKYRELDRLV